MHVVIAPDKFKGTLTAAQVADAVGAGLTANRPDVRVSPVPVADGGDGTLDAALAAGFTRVEATATGPLGGQISSAVGVRDKVGVVELASASGLVLVPDGQRDAMGATSWGTGDLLRAALDAGCTQIVLGVGGSACSDGGAGMLQALGARLTDADGRELALGGGPLSNLADVDLSGLDDRLRDVQLVLATDVDNPLLGDDGAAAVYGPQKGASADDIELLEAGLRRWAELVDPDTARRPGAGAAGGVGYAAMAALGCDVRPGIEVMLELTDFHSLLDDAALVVTGEGSLDRQTLSGKAPAGVAEAARHRGVPVVAVCGQCQLSDEELRSAGIDAVYALTDDQPDLERCMAKPLPILRRLGAQIATDRLSGSRR